jgi:pyruvate,water dikinase
MLAPVDADRAARPSLDAPQVREIARLALELEEQLGAPQDIEWAYADGCLYALQSRPITTLPPDALFDADVAGSDVVIWDNSNIIESYAGVTTPLTFSHVSRAYREVYYQTCRLMGVPASVVDAHEPMFRSMLGLVRGRIYYNLLNWYRLLALFPLVGKSGSFMETMMGVKQSLADDLRPLFDEVVAGAPKYGFWRRAALLTGLAVRVLGAPSANRRFLERVDRVCRPLEAADLCVSSLPEQMRTYRLLEEEILRHWTAPIVNDTRCMIAFGMLKSLTEKWVAAAAGDQAASLQNDLLCGHGDLKSTEPMRLLLDIARRIDADAALRTRFVEESPERVWSALQEGFAPEIADRFAAYIRAYGYRCVDELKLETLDYHDRPELVVASVQGYLRHGLPSLEEIDARKVGIRREAERVVRQRLRGPRRLWYFAVLRWARSAVADRETLRFERTRTFGLVRRLFRGVGRNLRRLGMLEDERDVFHLTVEELIAFVEGRAVTLDLAEIARARRREFAELAATPAPPDRFVTKGAVGASLAHPALLRSLDMLRDETGDDPSLLRGTSCCPGIAEGPVRVAHTFADTDGLAGEILVTARTDPGWVPAFPACSGLIIERGSLLSHSAVVARELGIPTIVGVSGSPLARLGNGQRVRMDAGKGEVRIL